MSIRAYGLQVFISPCLFALLGDERDGDPDIRFGVRTDPPSEEPKLFEILKDVTNIQPWVNPETDVTVVTTEGSGTQNREPETEAL